MLYPSIPGHVSGDFAKVGLYSMGGGGFEIESVDIRYEELA